MDTATYVPISWWHVLGTGILLLLVAAVIYWLKLGLGWTLAVATLRGFVQLALVGFVLEWVFVPDFPLKIAVIVLIMAGVASYTACGMQPWRAGGLGIRIFACLIAGMAVTLLPLITLILDLEPWYNPQYSVPIAGMLLSNSMNAIVLYLDRLSGEMKTKRGEFEGHLSVGGTVWLSSLPMVREAARSALLPSLNYLMILGVVALPGMMAGQLIAGVPPFEAVKYQLVVMYLLTVSIGVAVLFSVLQTGWLIRCGRFEEDMSVKGRNLGRSVPQK